MTKINIKLQLSFFTNNSNKRYEYKETFKITVFRRDKYFESRMKKMFISVLCEKLPN